MACEQPPRHIAAAVPAIDFEREKSERDTTSIRKDTRSRYENTRKRRKNFSEISAGRRILIFLGSFGIFIVLWQEAAYLAGNSAILAGPLSVLNALAGMLQLSSSPGTQGLQSTYAALLETLEVVSLGLVLSVLVGVPIGIVMGRWRKVEGILEPWVSVTNSVPIVVLIPALYFSIGGGLPADIFIAFVLSVFSVIINTHTSVKYMSNSLAEVGKTFGANGRQFITKFLLPSSLPDIFAGIRIAVGRALLGAVMAEALLGGNHGLGGLMIIYEEILNTPAMMATVVLIAIVGIVLLQAPKLAEHRLFRWKEDERISRGIRA
ncbi:MAG TPA: ABC transporter permease [Nitrososphaerales archaeon]|nr:ABC transporter permease [Nitrososphaerales archaeon]